MAKQIVGSGGGKSGRPLRPALGFWRPKAETSRKLESCDVSREHPAGTRMRRSTSVVVSGLAVVCFFWANTRLDEPKPNSLVRESVAVFAAPPKVASILTRACADCHSNQPRWPWYSKVPPISWIVAKDVSRGRKAMNLSERSAQTNPSLAAAKLLAACADMQSGRMPLPAYWLLHPDSRLTTAEIDTVCQWTDIESRRILEAERLRKTNPKQFQGEIRSNNSRRKK